jgi:hypothetical protein
MKEEFKKAIGVLNAEDERQTALATILETIREQIRSDLPVEHRPQGLFNNIQNAVYAMRGREQLMANATIREAFANPLGDKLIADLREELANARKAIDGARDNAKQLADACFARAAERDVAQGQLLSDQVMDLERRDQVARLLGVSTPERPWSLLLSRLSECLTTLRSNGKPIGWQRRSIGRDGEPWSAWYMADAIPAGGEPTEKERAWDGVYSYEFRPIFAAPPRSPEMVSISRQWLQGVIKSLHGGVLPQGHIGDTVFLLRGQLQDILDREGDGPSQKASPDKATASWTATAAAWLRGRAEVMTNSLHCGDSASTIHQAHKSAEHLINVAKYIEANGPKAKGDVDNIALRAAQDIANLSWSSPGQRVARIQVRVTEAIREWIRS